MPLLASVGQLARDLSAQRLRTFMTVLGIIWGTVAVVVLLAFGSGLERQSMKNMHGMGQGIAILWPGSTTKAYAGFPDGRRILLREDDGDAIESQISDVQALSPEYIRRNTPARRGVKKTMPAITGIRPVYGEMRNILIEPGGRFVNDIDVQQRRRTAVLGDEIKNLLFGEDDAVGQYVMIGETPFVVVGVMQPKLQNSSYNARDKDRIFIPSTTHVALFGDKYVDNFVYQVADPERADQVKNAVYSVLGRKHRFDATDENALAIWDTNEADRFLKFFFIGFNLFMGIIGSFTLTVGGIGVANIMYVVVRERTREIGVKRSVGATRASIMGQFLMETFLIVFVGAVIGFLLAVLIVKGLSGLPIQQFVGTPEISSVVAVTTISLLAVIALFAGFFPARKASRLDPVECLRS